ncbi:aquaporin [Ancylobacter sp. G4_0304]|uniref:aquaporin n=1 Tax=Ancylobacter sp. G4_0304 TaxID=3114289 RepID=UPI0039C762EC
MDIVSLDRRLAAEFLGTALLLAMVIGSGIMGERLAGGNVALALLANTLSTAAGLTVLIGVFGPVSGAHFNPAVTLVLWRRREMTGACAMAYGAAQFFGGLAGVWAAHLMFGVPVLQVATKLRDGGAQEFSEAMATFGLIATVLACRRFRLTNAPQLIGLYIASAYWFTASTSFANPAVTLARALSDSFAGIAPASVPGFIAAQLAGAGVALLLFSWLLRKERAT